MSNTTKQIACPWCDTMYDDDPGLYYHKARCQERVLTKAAELLDEYIGHSPKPLLAAESTAEFRQFLNQRIERARYVGD